MELDAREHIDIELRNLEEKLLKLGRLAVDALSRSVVALKEQDVLKAREDIEGDAIHYELSEDIDKSSLKFMARFQP